MKMTKSLVLIAALAVVSASSFAADVTGYTASDSKSASINGGNSQNITFTSPDKQTVNYEGSYTIRNVPSVNGPPLTTSNDTCMGSSSGSVNAPGIGIGIGSTWVDDNCKRLKNSRELWNMGMKGAAMALMCGDPQNREALEITGYVCPQTEQEQKRKANGQAAAGPDLNDPIIRARLGK